MESPSSQQVISVNYMSILFVPFILECFLFFRYFFHTHDANYFVSAALPSGWTHIVVNYIGSGSGEGVRVFYNGQQVGSDTTSWGYIRHAPNGRIVIGRVYTDHSVYYSSVQIDQLALFNQSLNSTEISALYNVG